MFFLSFSFSKCLFVGVEQAGVEGQKGNLVLITKKSFFQHITLRKEEKVGGVILLGFVVD